ncbi:hypothetical protein [Campylobacter pinnipediorum]|uniref:hypothetical protein n=1 Tax=Campylobacter pinnipediorum TaxID=1965231 RepID=UPI00084DDCCA
MQNALIGISIGLALKGISSVKLSENSFNKLQKAIENTGAKAQKLNSILNKIKLNNIKIDGLEGNMSNFKSKIGEKLALGASVVMPTYILSNINAKFILSYNDCDLVRELYSDFIIKELNIRYTLNAKTNKINKELLIINF